MSWGGLAGKPGFRCTPVSYTHLDVYKRQTLFLMVPSLTGGPEFTFSGPGIDGEITVTPVSYTHLFGPLTQIMLLFRLAVPLRFTARPSIRGRVPEK